MGPKAFITCYVCSREFGSRSIPFHEPKCLERWRSSNRNLPPEKRLPTPVKPLDWKHNIESAWLCTNCRVSVPVAKKGEHAASCFGEKAKTVSVTGSGNNTNNNKELATASQSNSETAGKAAESKRTSPSKKKGKENRINKSDPTTEMTVVGSNAVIFKNEVTTNKRTIRDRRKAEKPQKDKDTTTIEINKEESTESSTESEKASTSDRSIRPQTKTLRRPTPNLKHPVIQVVDSDESGDNSDKSKEEDDNRKRMKHNSNGSVCEDPTTTSCDPTGGSSPSSNEHKPKNFIMYNKYNVERNTKTSPKERLTIATKEVPQGSSAISNSIPYPCNSCSRSFAPERLHSHSRKDPVGVVLKKSPSIESKVSETKNPSQTETSSPQKKTSSVPEEKKVKVSKSPVLSKKDKPVDNAEDEHESDIQSKSDKTTLSVPQSDSMPPRKTAHNSSMDICYLCGKDPSPSLLLIHEKRCLERWKRENGLMSPSRRKKTPKKVDVTPTEPAKQKSLDVQENAKVGSEIAEEKSGDKKDDDDDGDKASEQQLPMESGLEGTKKILDPSWQAVQAQLVPCPSCGRTFFPERLPVHQRVCKGKVSSGNPLTRAQSLRETSTPYANEENGDKQSMYVPCYICGKNFGTWVIQMHESQCLRKWRRANEKLPSHLQQQEPHKPQLILTSDAPAIPDDDESTDVAWESHLQQLVPCQRCNRTFFPDRLEIHGRSCKGPVNKQQHTPRSSGNKQQG